MKIKSMVAALALSAFTANVASAAKPVEEDDNTLVVALVVILGTLLVTSGALGATAPVTEVPAGQ